MKRKKFLSLAGLTFFSSLFFSAKEKSPKVLQTDCNDPVTPPVPEGPFYKDEKLNRIDIAETKKGAAITYLFKVEDAHCKPIKGAIVDIWQCDADGHYSDFKVENSINETWLRGHQLTGSDGICRFTSIFPGWYTGRITHVHAKVHINNQTVLTTNFFFPKDIENEVYKNAALYPKGVNPFTLAEDFELRGDKDAGRHDALVMKVTKDQKDNLLASYTIAIV